MSLDWYVVFGDPFGRKGHIYQKYVEGNSFDEAVKNARIEWAALIANVENQTQKFVPGVDIAMIAYDPQHKMNSVWWEKYGENDA